LFDCVYFDDILCLIFLLGIAGLQWKRQFGSSVSVTLNDNSAENCAEIANHARVNGMVTVDDVSASSDHEVQITCQDANVILHQQQFHFMYVLQYVCCFIMPPTIGKGPISIAFVHPSVCLSVHRMHSE